MTTAFAAVLIWFIGAILGLAMAQIIRGATGRPRAMPDNLVMAILIWPMFIGLILPIGGAFVGLFFVCKWIGDALYDFGKHLSGSTKEESR